MFWSTQRSEDMTRGSSLTVSNSENKNQSRRRRHHHHHRRLSRIMTLCRFRFRIYSSETYESIWTVGMTPWTGDQPDARPLPTQDNTTQKNADTHIHVSSEIRTRDPSVRAAEDSTCLRPRGQSIFFLKYHNQNNICL
jgi:hypothetical protein